MTPLLKGATVIQNGTARLLFLNATRNTLDGVRVVGDLELTQSTARVVIRNGLVLTGNVLLDKGGAITFSGDQMFNSGQVIFAGDSGALGIEPNTTLTLGPAIVVCGKSGSIGQGSFIVSPTRHLINQGLIAAEVAGGTLTVNPTQLENTGSLRADGAGAILLIRADPFINNGTIQELNGGKVLINP